MGGDGLLRRRQARDEEKERIRDKVGCSNYCNPSHFRLLFVNLCIVEDTYLCLVPITVVPTKIIITHPMKHRAVGPPTTWV